MTYFLNGLLVFYIIILFDFLLFEEPTLREEIFEGINFRKFFFGYFARINLCYLKFTKNIAGINFHDHNLHRDFAGIKFCGCLKEHFFHDPILWF